MILAGILTPDEAYHAIDWKSVILIGGLIPFGIAMDNTGASRLITSSFVDLLAGAHPIAVMLSVAVLTTALPLIISNVAATVLLVPLVLLLSAGIGVDPGPWLCWWPSPPRTHLSSPPTRSTPC